MPIFEPESDPADLIGQSRRVGTKLNFKSLTDQYRQNRISLSSSSFYTYVMIRVIVGDEYEIDGPKYFVRLLAVASPQLRRR